MAQFIFLQPSCDIHLVLDAGFKHAGNAMNNLKLTVFEGDWQGPESPPRRISRNFKIDPVTNLNQIFCDFYPTGQTKVLYDSSTGELKPQSVGEVFMQVRFSDPQTGQPDRHHYVVARIQVHQKMNGWWFGNNSLSVFRDDKLAHSQVSLYALFDETSPGNGDVGDITGHGYIHLSTTNTSTLEISSQYQDRIRGKVAGTAQLKGEIDGPMLKQSHTLPVEVVDFVDSTQPILKDVDVVLTKPRIEQHNILFVAEGFPNADSTLFTAAVTKIQSSLRSNGRHSPFNLLKDSFNIWKVFIPSKEKGITMSHEVMASGPLKGGTIPYPGTSPGSVPLPQLIEWAGLPNRTDRALSIAALRTKWKANNSDARLAGYQDSLVKDNVIDAWKTSFSEGILQARDSFYGLRYGFRWGERYSFSSTVPSPNAQTATVGGTNAFAQRIHEWYRPQFTAQKLSPDWRRFAPELRYIVDTGGGNRILLLDGLGNLILDHILKYTVTPGGGLSGTDLEVGRLWHNNFLPVSTAPRRQINSVGLVCILVNDGHIGGSLFNNRTLVGVSLDDKKQIITSKDTSIPNIRKLNRELDQDLPPDPTGGNVKVANITDTLAHEFGHNFILGDEYESSGGDGSNRADVWDNLIFYDTIASATPTPAGNVPKIDPDKVKWLVLQRIARADGIVKTAEKVSNTQVKLTFSPGRVSRWRDGEEVFLRTYKGDQDTFRRQLPIDPTDILKLTISGTPNTTDQTITLTGSGLPATLNQFRAGSVLFIPRTQQGLLSLQEVINHLKNTKVPLTNNFTTCNLSDANPDRPPAITGVQLPSNPYQLIGIYEGGDEHVCKVYRPAGGCKMREDTGAGPQGEFCFVCKYLIVNRVDPGLHEKLDSQYP